MSALPGKKKGRAAGNAELAGQYLFDAGGGDIRAGKLTKSSEAENAFEFACGGIIWDMKLDSTGMKLQGRNPLVPSQQDIFVFESDSAGNVLGFKTAEYFWKRLEPVIEPSFDGPTATIPGGHSHKQPVEELIMYSSIGFMLPH